MAVDPEDLSLQLDVDEANETDELILRAWNILKGDRPKLQLIDDYLNDQQAGPYAPDDQDSDEYKVLVERSKTNILALLRDTPAQSLFVEGYREAATGADLHPVADKPGDKVDSNTSLWSVWQRNGLDSKQVPISQETVGLGGAFVGVNQKSADPKYDYPRAFTLSIMNTVALYEDPNNDDWPLFVFTVIREPKGTEKPGRAKYWDESEWEYFEFDTDGKRTKTLDGGSHGFDRCPVVPFVCQRDLQGRTRGMIERLIPLQDRLNQTVFDLLVNQTKASFQILWAAGMTAPPLMERVPVYVGDVRSDLSDSDPLKGAPAEHVYGYRTVPVLDADDNPVAGPITGDVGRFIAAEDPNTTFGSIPPTPLDGFIQSCATTLSQMAIIGQLPPYYLLGDIANLSADALTVAESSLQRLVEQLKHNLGESWERVMALFAQALGRDVDYSAEMTWRDMSPRGFASTVDGLVKLKEAGIVPRTAIRDMVPGATAGRIAQWELADEEEQKNPTDPRNQLAKAAADAKSAVLGRSRETGAAIAKDLAA